MRIGKVLGALALAGVLIGAAGVPAHAAVISVLPASQTVNIGDTVFFDVAISQIDTATPNPIAAYDLTLTFNPSVLGAPGFLPLNGNPDAMGAAPDTFVSLSPGSFNFGAALIDPAIATAADLSALQGASFVAARFQFTALASGASPITLAVNGGGLAPFDFFADLIIPEIVNGQVSVRQRTQPSAPEPATVLLVGTGLALAVARRRRTHRP